MRVNGARGGDLSYVGDGARRTPANIARRLTGPYGGARIEEMFVDIARRLTSSLIIASLTLMALSACASGPMTMVEMFCCADQHGECEIGGQAEPCCGFDLQSDMGVLAAERSDTAAFAASQLVVSQPHQIAPLWALHASAFVEALSGFYIAQVRPSQLSTVLLI